MRKLLSHQVGGDLLQQSQKVNILLDTSVWHRADSQIFLESIKEGS